MKDFLKGFGVAAFAGGLLIGVFFFSPFFASFMSGGGAPFPSGRRAAPGAVPGKTTAQLVADARDRSQNVKALYMSADVANDLGRGATVLREHIIALAEHTEINGMVIDVKEVCGPDYNEARLKKLLRELREKNIWVIARIVVFKDASQREAHPEWYLTRRRAKAAPDGCPNKHHLLVQNPAYPVSSVQLWQDVKGGYWMDPASSGAREYLASFAKKMIDLGFDELQFDYVRFPSDGDVAAAQYPAWDEKVPKYAVIKSFFEFLNRELKPYKPDIILSADLFGYVAAQGADETIGQRLEDIGDNFDYASFMVYPSHYYNGLELPADAARDLAAVKFTFSEARSHPDVVVQRSLQAARDYLDRVYNGVGAEIASSSSPKRGTAEIAVSGRDFAFNGASTSAVRIRPWLEDFFHEADRMAGRPYGVEKMRLQIDAAQKVEDHGWMLWNASNVYTAGALKKE